MKNLIRKILREDIIHYYDDDYAYTRIASWLKPPYFKNMIDDLGFTDPLGKDNEEVKKILSEVFGGEVDEIRKLSWDGGYSVYMINPSGSGCAAVYEEKKSNGEWTKYEYNKNCDEIYEKRSDGYEKWIEYSYVGDKRYKVSMHDNSGYWQERVYDKDRNLIGLHYSDGSNVTFEYDKDGNEIYSKDTEGYWEKKKYGNDGKLIYEEHSDGYLHKWDKNGCEIYKRTPKKLGERGGWVKRKMDKRFDGCKAIYEERHTGFWIKRKFNKNGKLVYSETSRGTIVDKR